MVILAISLFRIWLIKDREIVAITPSPHDMQLYITNAKSLALGNWFGPYNERIITRGPVFPLFITGAYMLHIPLTIAQTLLYCMASLLFLACVLQFVRNKWLLIPLYTIILFNPFMFDHETFFEITRSALYPALSLAVALSAFGLIISKVYRQRLLYASALGIFFFLFWYYREEGFFLLPLLAVCYGYSSWITWKEKQISKKYIIPLLLPLAIFLLGTHALSAINKHMYGIYTTREFSHPSYASAFSVLLRIQPDVHNPLISLPKQTRHILYTVSPTFAKLQPFFEGQGGYDWAQNSVVWTGIPPEEHELAGGAFHFALRDAVWKITKPSQKDEQLFFEQLTKEINAACTAKYITCGLFPISGFTFFSPEDRQQFYEQFVNTIQTGVLANKLDISTIPKYSEGPSDQIALFREITRGIILTQKTDTQQRSTLTSITFRSICIWYQKIMPMLFIFFYMHFLIRLFKQQKLNITDWFQASLLLCSLFFYFIVAFFGTVKSPTNTNANSYTSGAYALLLLFTCLEILTVRKIITEKHNR
ncbi:MAG: hypothetical protein WAV51_00805 [Microgenomates group bacterium]